jgi:lipid-binding SYLF domain-containing protein
MLLKTKGRLRFVFENEPDGSRECGYWNKMPQMKRLAVGFLFLTFSTPAFAAAWSKDNASQLQKTTNVHNKVMETPDKSIPGDLAVCVDIIPSELKFALGFGGTYGRGVLVCRRVGNGVWGAPSMFTVGGGSFGFQISMQSTDVVFIVMNPDGARRLVQDSVKLDAEASAAVGPVGRFAQGATDAQLHAEILSYWRSQGVFAGVSLSGGVVKQDEDDNQKLYGRKVTAKHILIGGTVRMPRGDRNLDNRLAKYSPKGGQAFKGPSAANCVQAR